MKYSNRGFTVAEITIVLVIMGIISLYGVNKYMEKNTVLVVDAAATRVHSVLNATKMFRVDTKLWPSSPAQLSPAYLDSTQIVPPFGGSYTFVPTGDTLEVRFNASGSSYARRLMARLPEGRLMGSTVITKIGQPGWEPPLISMREEINADMELLYALDGSREITAPFAGGGQDALNLQNIEASSLIDIDDHNFSVKPSLDSDLYNLRVHNMLDTARLNISKSHVEGERCEDVDGNVTLDAQGNIMTCKNGFWRFQEKLKFRSTSDPMYGRGTVAAGGGSGSFSLPTWITNYSPEAIVVSARCEVSSENHGSDATSAIRVGGKTVVTTYAWDSAHTETSSMTLPARNISSFSISVNGCHNSASVTLEGFWY